MTEYITKIKELIGDYVDMGTYGLVELELHKIQESIEKLTDGILDITPNIFDDPNGAYDHSCPYCGVTVYRKGTDPYPTMFEMKHESECLWTISQKLKK